jgi:two-component system response regulator FixJ
MAPGAANQQPTIYVVDADPAVRDSLDTLLTLHGFHVEAHGSATEFLEGSPPVANACLVTEVHLPDMSGIELLEQLRRRGIDLPVIIIANRGDVPTAVRAIRSGAVDFLEKPFLDRALLQHVGELLETGRRQAASSQP